MASERKVLRVREQLKSNFFFFPLLSGNSKGFCLFCSFFERTLLLQRNARQVWMLFSILRAFTVKYLVHAYTVVPWGFLCSTVFNFTTISPPYLPFLMSQ